MEATRRQLDTQALLSDIRGWVDRLCAVADEMDARARQQEAEQGGTGAGADQGSAGAGPDR